MTDQLEQVCRTISEHVFKYTTEVDLQAELAELLADPWRAKREVRLTDGKSRIDLLIPVGSFVVTYPPTRTWDAGFGIEVKIKGSLMSVQRQLERYTECPEILALILITTKASHHRIPDHLNGKPVKLVSLIGAGL